MVSEIVPTVLPSGPMMEEAWCAGFIRRSNPALGGKISFLEGNNGVPRALGIFHGIERQWPYFSRACDCSFYFFAVVCQIPLKDGVGKFAKLNNHG